LFKVTGGGYFLTIEDLMRTAERVGKKRFHREYARGASPNFVLRGKGTEKKTKKGKTNL